MNDGLLFCVCGFVVDVVVVVCLFVIFTFDSMLFVYSFFQF